MPYVILSDSLQMKERLCELYPHFILSMDKPVLAIAMILNKSRTRFVIFFCLQLPARYMHSPFMTTVLDSVNGHVSCIMCPITQNIYNKIVYII